MDSAQAAAREAVRLFRAGILVLPALAVGLVVGTGSALPDAVFAALLVGTLPLMAMAQVPLLTRDRIERLSAYVGSIVTLMALGTVALILGALGPGLEAMGLAPVFGAQALRTTGLLAVAIMALGLAFWLGGELLGLEESDLMEELIPRNSREKGLFVLLSLAAGVGEEVVYRGWLIAVLAPVFDGPWVAALVSSMAFSLLHAYQGPIGILRSGLMGFLFAAAFIVYGSLWPLIVVHVAVDLFSGLVLGPRMFASKDAQT
jgi:membrane protease YdiL (CAAX protease family)